MPRQGPSRQVLSADSRGVLSHSERVFVQNWDDLPTSAFGEILTAELFPVLNLYFPYNLSSGLTTHSGIGGGTVVQESGMVVLSTSATSGSEARLQTLQSIRYTPGQGCNVRFTAAFTSGTHSSERQWAGMGDAAIGGFYFGLSGTQFGIKHSRFEGDEIFIPETEWNGDSVISIDHALGNVYNIQYQWLGFGDIKFNVENPVDGGLHNVHTIRYAGTSLIPSVSNPSMPLTLEVENHDGEEDLVLRCASLGAFHEGPQSTQGINFSVSGQKTLSDDSLHNLMTIKNNELIGSNHNHSSLQPLLMSLDNDGTKDAVFKIIVGGAGISGTFTDLATGASYASINKDDDDPIETAANLKSVFFVAKNSSITIDLTEFIIKFHPGQYLTIAAERLGNASLVCSASFLWREEY